MIETDLRVFNLSRPGLALAAASTLGLGLMLHAGTRVRKEPLPLLFVGIVAAIMALPIATGRFISAGMGDK